MHAPFPTTASPAHDVRLRALPPESAGRHMVRRLPTAQPEQTVGDLLHRLVGQVFDDASSVFVLDQEGRLRGLIPMVRLLAAAPRQTVAEICHAITQGVLPETDQEHTATFALVHGLSVVPVVDAAGHLLGAVPPFALLEILRREHVEDLHRLAGIRRETAQARAAIEAPPARRARDRLPWLLVGLLGSVLATSVMAGFEAALQAKVVVAFFIPAIVYLADAIGTQTEAIAVRGLSLSQMPIGRLMAGEMRTGFLIGLVLGGIALPAIWWVFADLRLAVAVSLALVAAGTAATVLGLLFPWLLARMGRDPAFGSGPVATIIQDVLSLLIYFGMVQLIVF